MKINLSFEYKIPRPTFLGCLWAAFAVFLGFLAKTIFDFFDSKNQLLRNIESISSGLGESSQSLLSAVDAISYANQLGRLDLVSMLLACLGIIIGFAAIFGFLHIKETSKIAAKEEVKEWLSGDLGRGELRKIVESYMRTEAENKGAAQPLTSFEITEIVENIDSC